MRGISQVSLAVLQRQQFRGVGAPTLLADEARPHLAPDHSMTTRDEAVFWLTAAAEIEHALLVQYLFAAYSINPSAAGMQAATAEYVKERLLQIAREEMGHLVTVENLLLLIGGSLHVGREHSPYASEVYPYRFKLESLSLDSLAKYTVAESPDLPPDQIPGLSEEDRGLFAVEILRAALRSNDGEPVRNVGPVYHRLRQLFSRLESADFRPGRAAYQAHWADWGLEANPSVGGLEVLVRSFEEQEPETLRTVAIEAITAIGGQGEASDMGSDTDESHFERFLDLYKQTKMLTLSLGRVPTWPVVRDPNTSLEVVDKPVAGHMVEAVLQYRAEAGRITNTRTRQWAALFNQRYRLLLQYLLHTFHRAEPAYATNGDRTPKGLLQYWSFSEMRRVKKIAEKLVQMRKDVDGVAHAGPPFELPYTLNLPLFEADRWRMHADVLASSIGLIRSLQAGSDGEDPFLRSLLESDETTRMAALTIAATDTPPAESMRGDYVKSVMTLEEAVRGFDIPRLHGSFWRDKSRDELVEHPPIFGERAIVAGDPQASALVQRISLEQGNSRRMPRRRPRIPQQRIDQIWTWIESGARDDNPPGRILGEPSPTPESSESVGPVPEQGLSFEKNIKVLFRDFDRSSMLAFGLDLHDFQQVRDNATNILGRLEEGSMPCDGAWPPEQIALFRSWKDSGFPA